MLSLQGWGLGSGCCSWVGMYEGDVWLQGGGGLQPAVALLAFDC